MTTTFDSAAHPRTPAGVTTGGQFATKPRSETDLRLTPAVVDVRIDESFPVPQANNLDAIASVPDIVAAGANTASGVAAALGMSDREGAYYADAAGYLGLVDLEPNADTKTYRVTDAGQALLDTDPQSRAALMVAIIDEVPGVQDLRDGDEEGLRDRLGSDAGLSGSTIERRMDTFRSWEQMTASPYALAGAVAATETNARGRLTAAVQVSVAEREAARARRAERPVALCPSCFMQMPTSGLCDSCD